MPNNILDDHEAKLFDLLGERNDFFIDHLSLQPETFQSLITKKDSRQFLDEIDEVWNNYIDKLYQDTAAEDELRIKLKELLAKRWNNIKGTYLSYTASPNSNATQFACRLANALANEESAPIDFLMPTIKHHVNHSSRDDLRELPLDRIIRLNITSDDNESLIPIDQFDYLTMESDISSVYMNPYLNIPVSGNEKKRMLQHSAITSNIEESFNNFQTQLKVAVSPNIYQALTELQLGLYNGGINGSTGATVDEASTVAYKALEDFRKFWNSLPNEIRLKAMEAPLFAKAINDQICNPSWTGSCVNQFSGTIYQILQREGHLLRAANLGYSTKEDVIQRAADSFMKAKKDLEDVLNARELSQYSGRDKLFLSRDQINAFVPPHFIEFGMDVLFVISGLNIEELEELCNTDGYHEHFCSLMKTSMPRLFLVLACLNPWQIEVFVRVIVNDILADVPFSNMVAFINALDAESAKAFIRGFKSSVLAQQCNLKELNYSLQKYSLEIVTIDELATATESAAMFGYFLQRLPNAQKKLVFLSALKEKISSWVIRYINCFSDIYKILSPEQANVFLDNLSLKSFLITVDDLIKFLNALSVEDAKFVVDKHKEFFRRILVNVDLQAFTQRLKKDTLAALVRDSCSWLYLIANSVSQNNFDYAFQNLVSSRKHLFIRTAIFQKLGVYQEDDKKLLSCLLNRSEVFQAAMECATLDNIKMIIANSDHNKLASLSYNNAATIAVITRSLSEVEAESFLRSVILLGNVKNKNTWKGADFKGNEEQKLITQMLLEITRYQITLRKQMYPLIANPNVSKQTFIETSAGARNLVEQSLLQAERKNNLTQLVKQYNYTLQLQSALRHPSPAIGLHQARHIFDRPLVRQELRKTNGFWEWIFSKLGFNKANQMLRLFDKPHKVLQGEKAHLLQQILFDPAPPPMRPGIYTLQMRV